MADRRKVFIFSPMAGSEDILRLLEDAGCELVQGDASWTNARDGDNEDELCAIAKECDVLMGATSESGDGARSERAHRSIRDGLR